MQTASRKDKLYIMVLHPSPRQLLPHPLFLKNLLRFLFYNFLLSDGPR